MEIAMRKAPLIILTLVVVFLSVVVGVLIHRARTPRAIPTEPAATNADYRLKQVRLQETGRDGSRWQLDAEYSETFEEQNTTAMKKVTIKVDQPSKSTSSARSWTVRWDAEAQRAWTNEPVTIYRADTVVRGTGFESRVAEEATRIRGRVRATFKRGAPTEPVAPGRP